MGFTSGGGGGGQSTILIESDAALAYGDSITIPFSGSEPNSMGANYLVGTEFKNVGDYPMGLLNVEGPTQFTADPIASKATNQQTTIESTETDDGQIIIVYRTASTIKFLVLNGTTYAIDVALTTVTTSSNTTTTNVIECQSMPGTNNFAIAWVDTTASNQGRFAIFSSAGATILAPTTFEASASEVSLGTFSDGRIICAADIGSSSRYTIFDSAGSELEASTEITAAGTSNNLSIAVLANDFFVVALEIAASDGAFLVYDANFNPSVQQVAATVFTDILNAASTVLIEALPDNDFVITYRDSTASFSHLNIRYEYVDDTTWLGPQGFLEVQEQNGTVGPNIDSSISQGLFAVADFSLDVEDERPIISLYEGRSLKQLITGYELRVLTPGAIGDILTFAMLIIDNKRIVIMYQDASDSDTGKFIVYQLEHFTLTNPSNGVATLTNYTGATQNVKMTIGV